VRTGYEPEAAAFAVYAASFCHFDAFLTGALIARFEPRLNSDPQSRKRLAVCAIGVAAIYMISYMIVNVSAGNRGIDIVRNIYSGILHGNGREVFVYIAVNMMAASILVAAIQRKAWLRLLVWKPLVAVGRVSYGGALAARCDAYALL
jgi:peptidoglycan/LPS O-acetylase OafA/YrhL